MSPRPLVAAVCFALFALGVVGCRHVPSEQERNGSDLHYDLGIQAQNRGNMQEAYTEFEQALELWEGNARAHNAIGLLLHLGFGKLPEAVAHFERAIALDPELTEARVNLGNVYLQQGQYEQAATYYEQALNDMRYATPYIAQGNLGMAEYRRGKVDKGINHIKAAVTVNPRFCLGYRNLGTIYEETGKTEEACAQYRSFKEQCPDAAEAYYREGVCAAKLGNTQLARDLFAQCEGKAAAGALKEDCHRWSEQLQ